MRGDGLTPPVRGARRAYRGADGRELQPAEQKRPPGQPDAHHPVPAELGTLGGDRVDGGVARLVHGRHQRAEGPRATLPWHLGRGRAQHPAAGGPPCRGAARPAGGPGPVHGRAEHLADDFEARATDGGELTTAERGPPYAAGPELGGSGPGYRRAPRPAPPTPRRARPGGPTPA